MPSLPSKTTRRKHVTPIANLHENDVWQRTFNLLGLEPLTPFPNANSKGAPYSLNREMASTTDIVAPSEMAKPEKAKITILDLPSETQKDIFKHASSTDLIALSLVSRHFRDIAAAQLYRNFHIVFPDEDDPSYESPIDGLAGGLDTLVTSDYNYARYLKEIVLGTLSGGTKGERAYRHYTYDLSCGKFMNTLFLLVLRKAHALETFKWDLRIEISRPVFKAMHQLKALQHLHLRMQAGPSLYDTPPPLPSLKESESSGPSSPDQSPSSVVAPPANAPHSYPSAKNALKSKIKAKDVALTAKVPPTFSGFKNLKSLSILDMDTLEYVAEIKTCIRASSSTLNKLKLSFSESRARQARKPPPAEDPGDESDQDIDEFGNMIPPPPPPPPPIPSSSEDAAGPAKAFRAQEEKKAQEAVLSRILGVESVSTKKSDDGSKDTSDSEEKEKEEKPDPGKTFIQDLTALSKKLMISINGTSPRTQQQKDALEIIEKAAKKYIEAKEQEKASVEKKEGDEIATTDISTTKPIPESSANNVTDKPENQAGSENKPKGAEADEKSSSMFDEDKKDRKSTQATEKGSNPEDINVDDPEVVADPAEFDDVSTSEAQTEGKSPDAGDTVATEPNGSESISTRVTAEDSARVKAENAKRLEVMSQLENFQSLKDKLLHQRAEIDKLNKRIMTIATSNPLDKVVLDEAQRLQVVLQAEVDSASVHMSSLELDVADLKQRVGKSIATSQEEYLNQMNEYVRNTRGLGLHTLSIYLIPIKASVLSKAIDITVLKHITLLNVGPQAPFWNLLAKENKVSTLPLQKIYTDNVTPQFLTLVAQLDIMKELFMLERNSKVPEYSFAPKTTVTIDHVRKQILKKHIGTLEKLMIKNENDYTWDANDQVIKLLCRRGKLLEELALSFGVRAVHTFNQYLPGLVSLRAMHIINFRNEDTCHWVVREIRKFAVDSVSHNPEMKLEYIALESTVERLVRRAKKAKPKGKGKAVDKGKGKETISSMLESSTVPTLDSILAPPPVSESSEDEGLNSEDEVGPGLKLETLEGVRFYDIFGVRIFRKDIMMGRL